MNLMKKDMPVILKLKLVQHKPMGMFSMVSDFYTFYVHAFASVFVLVTVKLFTV